jgi:hypothetical protein
MNKTVRRSLSGAATAIALLSTIAIQPAHAYTPPVPGTSIMRMTAPLPGPTNSVNLTPDAKGKWDGAYGKGLNARVMYMDVRSNVVLTFKYTSAAGLPYTNRTVYLIVNKKFSCSKTTFSTTQPTNYSGGNNRPSPNAIVRDWCGDQPQMGAGETAIQATTDAFGKATFNMQNFSITGEQFPKALNQLNTYSKGIPCGDDVMCMQTTIAPSLFPHPTEAQERGEDKDLIFLAFVNPKVTAALASQKAKAGTSKTITFKLTNLAKKPVSGTTVVFESFGEGGQPEEYSVISNAQGVATVKVAAPKGTVGLQVIRAKVFGAQIGTDSKIYWGK